MSSSPFGKHGDLSQRTEPFGKWTPLEAYIERTRDRHGKPKNRRRWKCRCACGAIHSVEERSLLAGKSTQCVSCAVKYAAKESKSPSVANKDAVGAYQYWKMRHKLKDRKSEPWLSDFRTFMEVVGKPPNDGKGMKLTRIDTTKPYGPGNLAWKPIREIPVVKVGGYPITLAELSRRSNLSKTAVRSMVKSRKSYKAIISRPRHESTVRKITCWGVTQSYWSWAQDARVKPLGLNPCTIQRRVEMLGWTPERALTTPPQERTRRKGLDTGMTSVTIQNEGA